MVVFHSGEFYVQTRGKQEIVISVQQSYSTKQEAKNPLYDPFLAAILYTLFLAFFPARLHTRDASLCPFVWLS